MLNTKQLVQLNACERESGDAVLILHYTHH
jgi:hypothetical protein